MEKGSAEFARAFEGAMIFTLSHAVVIEGMRSTQCCLP